MEAIDSKTGSGAEKLAWNKPKLQELGNIRQFVQTGGANGKSGHNVDGASMAGNETMN